MGAVVAVPLEEYLTTSYEHDCEWIDGELEERAMPDDDHSAIQAFFIGYFLTMRLELGVRVRGELRVKVAPRRYRISDVALVPSVWPRQAIPDKPPMLCIEILSPDNRMSRMQAKLADYVAMGVGTIWIVDPKRRTLFSRRCRRSSSGGGADPGRHGRAADGSGDFCGAG